MNDVSGLAEYTTPDGRTLRLPPALAASFAQSLTPVQPPPPPASAPSSGLEAGASQPPLPDPSAMPIAPMAAPNKPEAGLAEPTGAALTPAPALAPEKPAPMKPAPVATSPQQPASQQPKPIDLNKATYADVAQAKDAATNREDAAQRAAAQAQADSITAQGDAIERRNQQIDAILQQRQQAAQEKYDRINQATIDANKAVDAYANFKTSREMDHPVLGALSIALSGLGSALAGDNSGRNPALDLINQQLDKKVQLQLAERDKLKDVAGMKKQAIDQVRQLGDDKIAQYNLAMAGETDKAIRQLELIKTRSEKPQVQANAERLSAQLQQQKAGHLDEAVQRIHGERMARDAQAQQMQMHRETLGVQMAGQAETSRHNRAEEQLAAEQRAIEASKAAAAGNGALAKQIQERGIGGELTPVKDENGNVTGFKSGLMTMKNGDVWIPTGPEGSVSELFKQHSAANALVQTLDKIRALGPEWLSDTRKSDKKQQLDQLMGDARLQAIAAKGLGVPTGHDIELAENFLGTSDPTQMRSTLAGIMQSRESIVRDHNALLRTHGLDKDWSPPDLVALRGPAKTPEDKSIEDVMTDPYRLDSDRFNSELGGQPGQMMRPVEAAQRLYEAGGMLPSQRSGIDQWARIAKEAKSQKDRDKAFEVLESFANKAPTEAVRNYAGAVLQTALDAKIAATPAGSSASPEARVK